jgi:hypothetical protein
MNKIKIDYKIIIDLSLYLKDRETDLRIAERVKDREKMLIDYFNLIFIRLLANNLPIPQRFQLEKAKLGLLITSSQYNALKKTLILKLTVSINAGKEKPNNPQIFFFQYLTFISFHILKILKKLNSNYLEKLLYRPKWFVTFISTCLISLMEKMKKKENIDIYLLKLFKPGNARIYCEIPKSISKTTERICIKVFL